MKSGARASQLRLIGRISNTRHYAIIRYNVGRNRVLCLSINTKLLADTVIASAVLDRLRCSHVLNERKDSGPGRTDRRGCSPSNTVRVYARL